MSNIKSGRWRGQKAKYADPNHRRVPKTGATAALKDWVTKQDAPFISDAALAAMPHFTQRQLQNAFTVLKRRSVIRETGGWVCRSKVWEVIK